MDGSRLPALDHQIGRDWPVGELAHPVQVGAAFGGQRLDHAQAATLGDGSGQFGSRDIRHGRLDDGVLDVEQGLDAVGHAPDSLLPLDSDWISAAVGR